VKTPGYAPYQPQLKPVSVTADIWMVEGPEIGYAIAGTSLPCPTRMTVVRMNGSALWIHSPVRYSPDLAAELAALGEVAFIVAPNTHHDVHAADWATAFPQARLYASRDLVAGSRPPFDRASTLRKGMPSEWADDIAVTVVDLGSFVEAVFFHRPSRSLIVADLMQNFEASRVRRWLPRVLLRMGGATGPDGGPSVEIRLAGVGRRARVRDAREVMVQWSPERIILAHGRCYTENAVAEVRRAFRWAGR